MNVLILLKNDPRDQFIAQYAKDIFKHEDVHFHLLNVTAVNDEVPTQMNGQVLPVCTEFDLSGYHATAHENKSYMEGLDMKTACITALVGHKMTIIQHYVKENGIDFVIGGAHITSAIEDMYSNSFTSQVIEHIDVPYLTVKCEHPEFKLKRIALVREFKAPKKENLGFLKQLVDQFDAKLTLIKIKASSETESDEFFLQGMDAFRLENNLNVAEKLILQNDDKEAALTSLIEDYNVDLLALGALHKKGFFRFFGSEVRAQIVNHIKSPIVIY